MNPDCNILNPLKRDGTSQNQRLVRALHPSYVSVDERQLPELLLYARDYAALLRYYNQDNQPDGDWRTFIEQDISTLVAIISKTELTPDKEAFRAIAAFEDLFPPVLTLASLADRWYLTAIEGLRLHGALARTIQSLLNDAVRNTLSYALRGAELGLIIPADPGRLHAPLWRLDNIQPNQLLFQAGDPTDPADLATARERVTFEFDRVYDGLAAVIESAPDFLTETIEKYPRHQPHMALFLAFLHIFRIAQDHLNTLTRRHLNFYFRDVLQLDPLPARPDAVHLIFELAKGFQEHPLQKNTQFKAGKDDNKTNLFFAADKDLLINRARLDEQAGLKTLFIDKVYDADTPTPLTPYTVRNIYAAPVADSADGLGADLESEDGQWLTLGGAGMPHARVGFALASPMFLLREGSRTVHLTFHFEKPVSLAYSAADGGENSSDNVVARELKENILVHYTGEKGWTPASIKSVTIDARAGQTTGYYQFTIELAPAAEPVVPYDAEVLSDGLKTEHPVLKFTLDNDGLAATYPDDGSLWEADEAPKTNALPFIAGTEYPLGAYVTYKGDWYKAQVADATHFPSTGSSQWLKFEKSYPYRYFKPLNVKSLNLKVEVDDIQNLILESDTGVIDPAKPFQPFGPQPKIGSKFYVGNYEAFQKRLDSSDSMDQHLQLNIEWADLPSQSFANHYTNYTSHGITDNNHFTVKIHILKNGTWSDINNSTTGTNSHNLFDAGTAAPSKDRTVGLQSLTSSRAPEAIDFDAYRFDLREGFLRLELETSFLHKKYPQEVTEAVIAEDTTLLPNEPYTPTIGSLKLSYISEQTIDFSAISFGNRVEQLFHLEPFGWKEVYPFEVGVDPKEAVVTRKLVPEFLVTDPDDTSAEPAPTDAEGTLFIGLQDLDPAQSVSILFQMAEGSADPTQETQTPVWSYLVHNQWRDFESSQVLSDGTNGLLTSGIVTLAMPKAMTREHTRLPGHLHWIKVSVARRITAISRTIAVLPQALRATFDRQPGNDLNRLRTPLPAATVSKLRERQAAVKKITQPYASFGGKVAESVEAPEGVTGPAVFNKEHNEFYIRVSERLRHKNRGVTIFDYERLVLQQFPDIYKVKCLNHTRIEKRIVKEDGEVVIPASEHAPGHVKLIVLPSLRNQNAIDPMRPMVSLNRLREIRDFLRPLISDFVDLEVRNPDFESVQTRFKVRFYPEQEANRGFYEKMLIEDIKKFLAPWLYDEGQDLELGGRVHRSQIINFVEERDYVDFVTDFEIDQIISEDPLQKLINVEEAVASNSSAVLVSADTHFVENDIDIACLNPSS